MSTMLFGQSKASAPLRSLHWLMALAIIAAWVLIYSKGWYPKGSGMRDALKQGHILAGFLVFMLLPLRVVVRLGSPLPPIQPPAQVWQTWLADAVQLLLYVCMLVLPILGILFVQAAGKPVVLVGIELPTLIETDKALSHKLKEIHESLGLGMLFLVLLHATAALWHHFIRGDDTLKRMG